MQNRASLGGNICNAAPSADTVPALICLGADVRIAGPDGARECKVEDLFEGPGRTRLAGGEIVFQVSGIERGDIKPYPFGTYLTVTPTLLSQ